jgi:iron complex outermembrane recepter protein
MLRFRLLSIAVSLCILGVPATQAQGKFRDLTEISIEALMSMEVTTTVARKEQRLTDTSAAVFVITGEDIRRSGVTSIPEALRMVPGIQVARIDSNKWAVSARGFNGFIANKLLVLMDGRSVYSPLYSGVYWDVQDTLIEDIARIEVIRGPGASLWGANAVNGVINIITKPAIETQGGLLTAGAGREEEVFGSLRYGGAIGDGTHFRMYGKYFERDNGRSVHGEPTNDQWDMARGGGRIDWQPSGKKLLTVQGDYYKGAIGNSGYFFQLEPPYLAPLDNETHLIGGNLLARWQQTLSTGSNYILQIYWDRAHREATVLNETRDTWDMDFQHRFNLGRWQEMLWGFGYRLTRSQLDDSQSVAFLDTDRRDQLFSFFIQDEITLVPARLSLLIGSKFEENDYTGFEMQPNVLMLWTPVHEHTFWTAVSRAVRTPAQAEVDASMIQTVNFGIPETPDHVVILYGADDFASEELIAYELGYRYRPVENFSLDLALFYNVYEKLRTIEPENPYLEESYLVIPYRAGNNMKGDTYGLELALEYNPVRWWRLKGAYTYLRMDLEAEAESLDTHSEKAEEESPRHQISLRSSMDLSTHWEWDLWLRYVDALPAQQVSSIFTMDLRLAWRATPALTLSLVGRNLLNAPFKEFGPEIIDFSPTQVERSVYGKIEWQF